MDDQYSWTIHDLHKAMQETISLNFDWDSHEDLKHVSMAIYFLEEFNEDPNKFLEVYRKEKE